MPWQAQVANVAGELDPLTNRLVYREVRVKVPRQSGKTTIVLTVEMDRCLYWGPQQRCVYTAQDRNNARLKWEEQGDYLMTTQLRSAIDIRRQTGLERIIVPATGSSVGISASGDTSGHGFYLDLAVIDEAWAQKDERLTQAFRPAMITRSNTQTWVLSTEGTDESVFLNDRVEDGRARVEAGQQHNVAYFEWAAGDEDDPDDEDTWWRCMPALGITVPIEAIREDHDIMDAADFSRAYLNRRAPKGLTVIPAVKWHECRDPHTQLRGMPRFAIDTTPDRAWTSIGVAGWRDDGDVHVEIVEHRPATEWVVERMRQLTERWGADPILIDPAGPAGSLLIDFAGVGIPTETVGGREYAQACAQFYDSVLAGQVRHLDQPVLNSAVSAARKRPLGDAWAWGRKFGGDVSPLVAATLARYGLVKQGRGEPQIL
jgi:phage terminase large subunit-like protein